MLADNRKIIRQSVNFSRHAMRISDLFIRPTQLNRASGIHHVAAHVSAIHNLRLVVVSSFGPSIRRLSNLFFDFTSIAVDSNSSSSSDISTSEILEGISEFDTLSER
jgi:hypothetical protein